MADYSNYEIDSCIKSFKYLFHSIKPKCLGSYL